MAVISKVLSLNYQSRLKLVSGFHGLNELHQQRWFSTELGFKPRINLKLGPDRILPAISPVTVNLDGVVQLRMGEGLGSREPISCYSSILKTVETVPGATAIVDPTRSWTYEEYFKQILCVSRAFIELGLQPHRTVAIIGSNSPEWVFSAVGAVFAGGLYSGVYTTNTTTSVLYQLQHSKANIVVVEDEIQLKKILPHRDQLPDLRAIIMYGEIPEEDGVLSWEEFLNIGNSVADLELRSRLEGQAINQPAILCYTSGTTAKPKGALLSQDNITWTVASAVETYKLKFGEESMLSYLPLSHIVSVVSDIWMLPSIAGTLHFVRRDRLRGYLLQSLIQARPTRFVSVPRVYEKVQSELEAAFGEARGGRAKLLSWARNVSTQHYDSILNGGKGLGLKYSLAHKLVLSKIHQKLGMERCLEGLYSGAAPLSTETSQFMKSLGLIVSEIYGMTENPNQTANQFLPLEQDVVEHYKLGSVGRSAVGCQTKLHLQDPRDGIGEVACSGRNVFMGYLRDATRTRETFDRGFWLLTGDMATIEDGFITIKGRIKDVIITSGGKNIAPYPLEKKIKGMLADLVSHCMVVGNKQTHLTCLITVKAVLDPATLEVTDQLEACAWEFCLKHGCKPSSVSDLAKNKEKYSGVYDAILSVLEQINKDSPSQAARIRKFTLLPVDFSVSGGELGPTMKMKRHAVEEKYKTEIKDMHASTERTSLWDD
ncbi:long-chain-fatty-acid--CoA ligase ACSBG2 [Eurytemora carolleeae]|uniref:long-chain-fatty-acid--CoA ligase ACSBG2 n=1 Tax=Eurytemora carolleeae TaxID=1294199 RepID=UPI000C78D0DD|nr:long-chain-fatty-acid--CoA ligase ACSBG2 [Eurytemora carolleeae]|eukprot:XP_023337942.1 long-chain-fatty-acid--CoA ligase ACSBG2-like [Eurytemora affinis]